MPACGLKNHTDFEVNIFKILGIMKPRMREIKPIIIFFGKSLDRHLLGMQLTAFNCMDNYMYCTIIYDLTSSSCAFIDRINIKVCTVSIRGK